MNKPVSLPGGDVVSSQSEPIELMSGVSLRKAADWTALFFAQPFECLSSAVVNGGMGAYRQWLNLKVSGDPADAQQTPTQSMAALCSRQNWQMTSLVGMMTAASMNSLRVRTVNLCGESLLVVVTTGLANARRAGDKAEYRQLSAKDDHYPLPAGTINMAVVTSAALLDAAKVEALLTATEAKTVVMQNLAIRSVQSDTIATGTGTDAIALFSSCRSNSNNSSASSGRQQAIVEYAGKHTLFGEVLAKLVIAAMTDSIEQRGALIGELTV